MNIQIVVQPFDRNTFVNGNMPINKRLFWGLKEYSRNIEKARKSLNPSHYDIVHLCSSRNLEGMADALEKLINISDSLYDDYSQNDRVIAESKLSSSVFINNYIGLL